MPGIIKRTWGIMIMGLAGKLEFEFFCFVLHHLALFPFRKLTLGLNLAGTRVWQTFLLSLHFQRFNYFLNVFVLSFFFDCFINGNEALARKKISVYGGVLHWDARMVFDGICGKLRKWN